ncbi:tripartite tricarboxylate transporter substrate binding protein [Bradyrhizobium sp. AUGA SZCCT0042]|uniref:tripartite tricarboxylate transporter substrate binding protein n=1 Tax=Bradyrhizobium sp. AUGA SZCCT0042 TaxID=2807651 RepID=UPI001BA99B04|nr:tripartite tricarboxylate transporter substrate binding protein [Bradyrhizobium sp. AUGA SZCCT0042]MBR1301137.1 tripartite tricarboxylate transporter substrate binding protein [Bradyrhizobium sp. AUGA SZCCT0042]
MSKTQRAEVTSSARRLIHFASRALLILLVGSGAASAQTASTPSDPDKYPSRTIRYIVPYPPGGFNDTLARIVSQKLSEACGVPVVVENRSGGGTQIGSEAAAKAAPDGYTLLGVAFAFGSNPSIYKTLPYDTVKDFTPLIFAGQSQNLLVIRPSMSISSVKELIDHARKNPGKISYGSAGIGSSNHLSMELFKSMAGIDMVHVPYRGSGPLVSDLLGGHVDLAFDNTPNVLPQVNADKLRALGVSSKTRSALAVNVPTVSEAGVPGYEVTVWFGIVGPAGMRLEIVQKLNAELNAIFKMDDVKRRFVDQGVEPVGGTPSQLADQIRAEIDKWAKVVKDANIQPE